MTTSEQDEPTWTNWAGNQRFVAAQIAAPTSEAELIELVQQAVAARRAVGIVGSAHSFTPIVETSGLLIKIEGVNGVLSRDRDHLTAEALAGTSIRQLGRELWAAGLSMRNQGDIDKQTIAGAISTGTHGSGIEFGSLSSAVRGIRIVTGTGEVVDIDETQPDLLHAAQVSVGLLGVITRLTLEVMPAYWLKESNRIDPIDEVLEHLDQSIASHRHYSFFWAPGEESGSLYDLPHIPTDHCYVKVLEEVAVDPELDHVEPISGPVGGRTGRAYLIYPDTTDEVATWIELEYMIDAKDTKDAFLTLRRLMQERFPEAISPIEVRWTKREPAFLSPHYGHDTCSISVSGLQKHDWDRFLRAVDEALRPWHPRSHWGKFGYLDHARLTKVYPKLDRFVAVREELDPHDLFLNNYFRDILGL